MADERPSTLVIGGAGNLGRRIIACLLERGASCVGSFDLVAYAGDGADRVVSACGDITDADALARAMVGVKTVYHTASIIDIRPVPSLRMHHVNVTGTECVIEACKAAGVGALLYTSSLEVVSGCNEKGVTRKLDGVDESVPVPAKHHLPYANTKAYAERLVLAADSTDLRTCSIRPGYIMGAECIGLKMEMLHAAARHDHYVTAKIPATISTVHAANAALMHVMAAEQISAPDVHGKAFFCRDFEANVVSMALEAFAQTPIKPVLLPLRVAYALAWLLDLFERLLIWIYALLGMSRVTPEDALDITAVGMAWIDIVVTDARARRVLGYEPRVSRAECMREATEWCTAFYGSLKR